MLSDTGGDGSIFATSSPMNSKKRPLSPTGEKVAKHQRIDDGVVLCDDIQRTGAKPVAGEPQDPVCSISLHIIIW